MMRISYRPEPSEEFREFFQHPGWRVVFQTLDQAVADLMERAARDRQDHDYKTGVLEGAELIVTRLRSAVEQKGL